MTLVSGPDPSAPPAPQCAPPGQGDIPVQAEGLELLGEVSGSGYHDAPSLVRRGDGQTFQLTQLVYMVLDAVDGHRDHEQIASIVSDLYGRHVRAEDVAKLVDSKLRPLGLLAKPDGSQPELKRSNPLLALRLRWVVSDPRITNRITRPFAALFHPIVLIPVIVAFALITTWLLVEKGLASATHSAFDTPGLLLTVFALSVLSAGFHEFGHAAAARYGGATPGAMGVGLYLVWPAFYTDVTDSYRLGRAGRVRTDLGGVYFNAIFTLAAFGLWWATGWDALLLVIAAQLVQMIQQMSPLMRFDGYHVLADITGVPDLYQRIKPTLLGLLPWRWGHEESKVLKPWARALVALWVLIVIPAILIMLVLMVLAFPRVLGTAWRSLQDQSDQVADAWGDADALMIGARLLTMLALVVPIAGMIYILVRLIRKASNTVWRATDERPRRRLAAKVTALALIGGLSYAWWPDGNNYRPVEAWEQGGLGDAFEAVAGPAPGLRSGGGGEAQTAWPDDGTALPTREKPALAVLMVPVDDPDAPTWVFPFNRPLPPGTGDNQALAVNTKDGTVVYEVAFALVWARDGSALNKNEAYAFASCEGCAAVAVGFQVILMVGEVDVAVPQNLAGSVTYACVSCVTYALATQLVISLPGELSAAAMDELAVLWDEIRLFGENIQGVALSDLQGQLDDFKTRIVDIIERDVAATTAATTPTTQPGAVPVETVTATTVVAATSPPATPTAATVATTEAGTSPTEPTPIASSPQPEPSAPSTNAPTPATTRPPQTAPATTNAPAATAVPATSATPSTTDTTAGPTTSDTSTTVADTTTTEMTTSTLAGP